MRRSLIGALALFTAAVLCIGASFASVSPAKDNIEYTQETVFGDPNVLEGLNVSNWLQYNRRLCWKNNIHFEKNGAEVNPVWTTEFHRLTGEVYQNLELFGDNTSEVYADSNNRGLNIYTDSYIYLQNGTENRLDKYFQNQDPQKPVHLEVKAKDLSEYYNFFGSLDLPGLVYSMDGLNFLAQPEIQEELEKEKKEPYAGELETAKAVADFLKIPVLEEETLVIEGYQDSYNISSKDSLDSFTMYTESVFSGDKCFFWFNNRTAFGNLIDCSQIPGGYGIYSLPYKFEVEEGKGWSAVKSQVFPEKLCLAYPVDEESYIFNVSLNGDKTQLRMVTRDGDDMFRLTVIDAKSFETIQVLDICSANPEKWCFVNAGDDFLICTTGEDTLHVYYDPGTGLYEERICLPIDFSDEKSVDYRAWLSAYKHSVAFDGKRLACSFWNTFEFENEELYGPGTVAREYTANLCIAVYDKDGLQYAGNLISSLDKCNQYKDSGISYKYYSNQQYIFEEHWTETLLSWD